MGAGWSGTRMGVGTMPGDPPHPSPLIPPWTGHCQGGLSGIRLIAPSEPCVERWGSEPLVQVSTLGCA